MYKQYVLRLLLYFFSFLFLLRLSSLQAAVVINEIYYNPSAEKLLFDARPRPRDYWEFVELYNSGQEDIDLSNYYFDQGVQYVFPNNSLIKAQAYAVVVREPTSTVWIDRTVPVYGPFLGALDNKGETITLKRSDGTVVDSFTYRDTPPWPQWPDGYGSSLERISWSSPTNDFHSWRSSEPDHGTPGLSNSVCGLLSKPVISSYRIMPTHPTSKDIVTVNLGLDEPERINHVDLLVENLCDYRSVAPINLDNKNRIWRYHKGLSAPANDLSWTQLQFDDSTWNEAQMGLGYEPNFNQSDLSDMPGNYSTVYLRKKLVLEAKELIGKLYLQILADDGFVCYINGKELARAFAPVEYSHNSLATDSHDMAPSLIFNLGEAAEILKEGENIVALVGLNVSLDSPDFKVYPSLNVSSVRNDESFRISMNQVGMAFDLALFEAEIQPATSQSLIRLSAEVTLDTGQVLQLPSPTERKSFISYFVYDYEVETDRPIVWIFDPMIFLKPGLKTKPSGAVIQLSTDSAPLVFDGALVEGKEMGQKIRFLKSEKFQGQGVLNLQGASAYYQSIREHLSYGVFGQMNIPVPWCKWFRVISFSTAERPVTHSQQLIVQQIDESFLQSHGLSTEGNLFKREKWDWEDHSDNPEGLAPIERLVADLKETESTQLRKIVMERLNVDEFLDYIATSVFLGNWEGFYNNHWMYADTNSRSPWIIIPWDLDQTWGYMNMKFVPTMDVSYPLDGKMTDAKSIWPAGMVTSPIMRIPEFYDEYIHRLQSKLENRFAIDRLQPIIREEEKRILDDLVLIEKKMGASASLDDNRRTVQETFSSIEEYIQIRHDYLRKVLPTAIECWELY